MKLRIRSPVRKPVQAIQDGQEPQMSQRSQRKFKTGSVEDQMSGMDLDDDDDDLIDARPGDPQGRTDGRDRDTAMFDPRRGTYLPYGGFASVIDDYYTEGDHTTLKIPTPTQLKRREQSRSPQRLPKSSSLPGISQNLTYENDPNGNMPIGQRPVMDRQVSAASAHSSGVGSFRGSPNRQQRPHGNNEANGPARHMPKPAEYYDDGAYYEEADNRPRAQQYPRDSPPSSQAYEEVQHFERERYRPPPIPGETNRGQRPPQQQIRPQRSMDFQQQGRGAYPSAPRYDDRPLDPRRRDAEGNDPRAFQQDPRLAPRPHTGNDPRMRPQQPRQMGPPNGHYPPSERNQMRGPMPTDDYSQREDRQQMRQGRDEVRGDDRRGQPIGNSGRSQNAPMREQVNGGYNGISPYPTSPSDEYRQGPPTQLGGYNTRSPGQEHGAPRPPQAQGQPREMRGPQGTPPLRHGPGRPEVRPAGANQPLRQPPQFAGPGVPAGSNIPPPNQQQRQQPPLQQQVQQPPLQQPSPQPVQQSPPHRPTPARKGTAKTDDASDMIMHSEPVGKVTMAEVNKLRKEAKGGTPMVQLTLVKRLIEASAVLADDGGKADPKQAKKNREEFSREALRTLKQITAQDKPYPEAVFFLANCYGNGALSLEVDHERAFSLYESAAKMQHPASAYRTAVCLEIGAGTRQDVSRAVRFYERAAEYGDAAAMYKIGMIQLRGLLDQKPEPRVAVTWLQKAAEKADIENPHALHELALLYEKGDAAAGITQNETFAKDLFIKAAKLHYAPSQFRMGYAYEYGTLGCPVDPRRSIAWFSRGAERGDPESELSLSGWYLTGSEGILVQNDREAYLWGRKAAEKGLAKAEFAVGYFFESGIGTAADIDEAIKWYKRAATAGQKKAQERLLALGKRKR